MRRQKFRNLSEIYEKNEAKSSIGLNSLFALFCHVDDPIYFEDFFTKEKWVALMNEEMEVIEKNDTWDLVDLLEGKEVIGVKWVYKTKKMLQER